jgi:MoxR-like ATPase
VPKSLAEIGTFENGYGFKVVEATSKPPDSSLLHRSRMDADIRELTQIVERESEFVDRLEAEIGKIIVGQKPIVERLLIGLLSGGHILLEGVPGLAKTLAIKTLATAIQAKFQRIQFTPDLLPADLIGTLFFNQKDGNFYTKKGPIFAN